MAARRQTADILELRLVLLGVNLLIWRRLLVRADASVADLHDTLQIAMRWEDVHLHRFHIRGRDYGLSRVGRLNFADNAHEVRLDDLGLRLGERFVYEYGLGDLWVREIRRARALPAEPRKRYPQCIGGQARRSARGLRRVAGVHRAARHARASCRYRRVGRRSKR